MSLAGAEFYKVSGGGNDFIALVEPSYQPPPAEIQAICRRGLSIGADGLFLLDRRNFGAVGMRHFNADGSAAALCLNGTRCAAQLAFELEWAQDQVFLLTGAGTIRGEKAGSDRTRLHLPPPKEALESFEVSLDGLHLKGCRTIVGVPHLILLWDGPVAEAPIHEIGAALVHHSVAGPEGANVNFVAHPVAGPPDMEHFAIRTYERGVNAETLACGTGVMASALHLHRSGLATFPLSAHTAGGFVFTVDGQREGHKAGDEITSWSLAGDARIVAQGHLLSGALSPAQT